MWFTNGSQQFDRADHDVGAGHELHRPRHLGPAAHHGRARRRAVVHELRSTTRSVGSRRRAWSPSTTASSILAPQGITVGPDGALWFTNAYNNSIGRITTSGAVSNFTGPSISSPSGIAAGPDGALWFTNVSNNSIGRITTSGAVTNFTDSMHLGAVGHHAGPGRCAVVHQLPPTTRSVGSRRREWSRPTQDPSISGPSGIAAGPDGALWFTNMETNRIGRITTAGVVSDYPAPNASGAYNITRGIGSCAVVHQLLRSDSRVDRAPPAADRKGQVQRRAVLPRRETSAGFGVESGHGGRRDR